MPHAYESPGCWNHPAWTVSLVLTPVTMLVEGEVEEEQRTKRPLSEGINLRQNPPSRVGGLVLISSWKTRNVFRQIDVLFVSFKTWGWLIIVCPTDGFGTCQPIKIHKVSKIGYSFSQKCTLTVL